MAPERKISSFFGPNTPKPSPSSSIADPVPDTPAAPPPQPDEFVSATTQSKLAAFRLGAQKASATPIGLNGKGKEKVGALSENGRDGGEGVELGKGQGNGKGKLAIPVIQLEDDDDEDASTSFTSAAPPPSTNGRREDDDDLVIVASGSTNSSRSPSKARQPSSKKALSRKSTPSTAIDMIDITISPPCKSAKLLPSTLPSFRPLSEVHKKAREKRKANEPVEVRWPTAEEHGQPSAPRTSSGYNGFQYKEKGKGQEVQEEEESSMAYASPTHHPSAPPRQPYYRHIPLSDVPSIIPPDTTPHPLLDRLSIPFKSRDPAVGLPRRGESSTQLWTAEYAPKKAEEVLGIDSGRSAALLKGWLEELALSSSAESSSEPKKRRRQVVRTGPKVSKRRRRANSSDLDDFLASDEEEYDETTDESGDESCQKSQSPFGTLTNLVLLYGPTGSGKSSTVQAVAEELGFSVFEVNAGMGKRGAKEIERYVGDVGRNHMVRQAGSPSKKDPFAMFKKAQSRKGDKESPVGEGKATKQSLILFEEVDVLYKEEKDFWTGLISIAQHSRRPVVMTCTDMSDIPFNDLELQQVKNTDGDKIKYLAFAPPESKVVIPFLQLAALSEGHILSSEHARYLYETESKYALPPSVTEQSTLYLPHPYPTDAPPAPDLRRALMQLQFGCQSFNSTENSKISAGDTVWIEGGYLPKQDKLVAKVAMNEARAAELASWADAFVSRRPWAHLEHDEPENPNTELDQDKPPTSDPDEEVRHTYTLIYPPSDPNRDHLAIFGREDEMASYLFDAADALSAQNTSMRAESDLLRTGRAAYSHGAGELAFQHVNPPTPLLPNPTIITDYLPCFRAITAAEDILSNGSLADDAARYGRHRRSNRLAGTTFTRRLPWKPYQASLLRESQFPDLDDAQSGTGSSKSTRREEDGNNGMNE